MKTYRREYFLTDGSKIIIESGYSWETVNPDVTVLNKENQAREEFIQIGPNIDGETFIIRINDILKIKNYSYEKSEESDVEKEGEI